MNDLIIRLFEIIWEPYSRFMQEQIDIIVPILVAILTGGFLMLFIENQHITSSVNERYDFIMKPFYHKLTNYYQFVASFRIYLRLNDKQSENAEHLYNLVEKMGHMAFPSIMNGRDYPVTYFKARRLEELCKDINDIWFTWDHNQYYIKDHLYYETDRADQFTEEGRKCLHEVNPAYDNQPWTLNFLSTVSGDFFAKIWQPVAHVPFHYEVWCKKASEFNKLTIACIFVALATLAIILLIRYIVPISLITFLAFASIALLAFALYKMIKLNEYSSRLFR